MDVCCDSWAIQSFLWTNFIHAKARFFRLFLPIGSDKHWTSVPFLQSHWAKARLPSFHTANQMLICSFVGWLVWCWFVGWFDGWCWLVYFQLFSQYRRWICVDSWIFLEARPVTYWSVEMIRAGSRSFCCRGRWWWLVSWCFMLAENSVLNNAKDWYKASFVRMLFQYKQLTTQVHCKF